MSITEPVSEEVLCYRVNEHLFNKRCENIVIGEHFLCFNFEDNYLLNLHHSTVVCDYKKDMNEIIKIGLSIFRKLTFNGNCFELSFFKGTLRIIIEEDEMHPNIDLIKDNVDLAVYDRPFSLWE